MKKYLIFSILLITSFFGLNKVYAIDYIEYNFDDYVIPENTSAAANKIVNFLKDNYPDNNFIVTIKNNYNNIIVYILDVYSNATFGINSYISGSYNYIKIIKTNSSGYIYSTPYSYLVNDILNNELIKGNLSEPISNIGKSLGTYNLSYKGDIELYNSNDNKDLLYYSNKDIKLTNLIRFTGSTFKPLKIIYNKKENIINLNENIISYSKLKNKNPEISFDNYIENEDGSKSIDINISNLGYNVASLSEVTESGGENFIAIGENYTYKTYRNISIVVKIVDDSGNYVMSESYTFTGIKDNLPYLEYELVDSDSCIIENNNKKYTLCKLLKIKSFNLGFNDRILYSYDAINWEPTQYSLYITENRTVFFKIVDVSNKDLYTESYTITSLDTIDYSNLDPFILFEMVRNDRTLQGDIKILLNNFSKDEYKAYYSLDTGLTFIDITNNLEIKSIFLNQYFYNISLNNEETIIVKITDLNDNYISSSSYKYIAYTTEEKKIFDYIIDFKNNTTNIIGDLFKNVYNLLRNTKIGLYILFIIISSIIIYYIKSMQR